MAISSLIDKYRINNAPHHFAAFVDGNLHADFSQLGNLPEKIILKNLPQAVDENAALIQNTLQQTDMRQARLGLFLHVPQNIIIDKPIHILFLSTVDRAHTTTELNNFVIAENNSQLTIIEEHASTEGNEIESKISTTFFLRNKASINLYKIQASPETAKYEHRFIGKLKGSSTLKITEIDRGGKNIDNSMQILLEESAANFVLYHLYLPQHKQNFSTNLQVQHIAQNCLSTVLSKGIIDDEATANFAGRIIVHKNAANSGAKLTNKNLLLSKQAKISTAPEMEIYHDNVKCFHGATVGQLDQASLWYMQSRGIAETDARRILLDAFAQEILETLPAFFPQAKFLPIK